MDSLYTDEVRRFVNTRDWPSGLIIQVAEQDEPAPHLNLIFYRDNWLTFDFEDQSKITSTVKEVMEKLWSMGIPTYVGKMESQYGD